MENNMLEQLLKCAFYDTETCHVDMTKYEYWVFNKDGERVFISSLNAIGYWKLEQFLEEDNLYS
jgi:hypothetical protein